MTQDEAINIAELKAQDLKIPWSREALCVKHVGEIYSHFLLFG